MTDRRRRAALAPSTGTTTGTVSVLLRKRWSFSGPAGRDTRDTRSLRGSSGPSGSSGSSDDNPFAPPPEGRPEQPWRPRRPHGSGPEDPGQGDGGNGDGERERSRPEGSPPNWGSRWSSRQPHRQGGDFGGGGRPEKPGGRNGGAGGPRWDPSDPAQRRARYALLAGMWGFFFALFSIPWLATPLGALAVYWGVSALRTKPRGTAGADVSPGFPDRGARPGDVAGAAGGNGPGPAAASAYPAGGRGGRPQTAVAVSGLVAGVAALAIIAAQFTVQLVYRDYFVCVEDALTNSSREACERHLPEELRPLFGEQN
ncbi:hypothetical protein V1L54_08385 [Streptomyces sp. TRM 70361]|uniref:hypothetical protein n=1 Tax=Streptomyces sp. TRM 70361 TaxID=3116553 RepID=UPI002E7B23C1|nr:hypothetical protein [Streptomyces sp. TRM 70361]MEE1939432.1 hypothetical protein [Streptomyces sp. TRM 70361]